MHLLKGIPEKGYTIRNLNGEMNKNLKYDCWVVMCGCIGILDREQLWDQDMSKVNCYT